MPEEKYYDKKEFIQKIDAMMYVGKERIADIYGLVMPWSFETRELNWLLKMWNFC